MRGEDGAPMRGEDDGEFWLEGPGAVSGRLFLRRRFGVRLLVVFVRHKFREMKRKNKGFTGTNLRSVFLF